MIRLAEREAEFRKDLKELLKALPKGKDITIINESPQGVKDSQEAIKIWKSLN